MATTPIGLFPPRSRPLTTLLSGTAKIQPGQVLFLAAVAVTVAIGHWSCSPASRFAWKEKSFTPGGSHVASRDAATVKQLGPGSGADVLTWAFMLERGMGFG